MIIHVTDGQVVGETESTLLSMMQQGTINALFILKNSGVNTLSYRFQQYTGTAWADVGISGTDYYNTLLAGETRNIKLVSSYPQVRLQGNASGGAFLEFAVIRYFNRASGGALPILSL
jgi:hypothetical protein